VLAGASIQVWATVVNVGTGRSRPYTLVLSVVRRDVSCQGDVSGSQPRPALEPGGFWTPFWSQGQCGITGPDPHLVFTLSVEQEGRDAHPGNDSASARVDIVLPEG
jgi:hypothetical protein